MRQNNIDYKRRLPNNGIDMLHEHGKRAQKTAPTSIAGG
jgi:hypothetical protein